MYDCTYSSPLRQACIRTERNCVAFALRRAQVWITLIVNTDISASSHPSPLGSPRTTSRVSCGLTERGSTQAPAWLAAKRNRGGKRRGARLLLLSWRSRVADVATCSPFSRSRCSASRHGYPRWTIRHQVKLFTEHPRQTHDSPRLHRFCTIPNSVTHLTQLCNIHSPLDEIHFSRLRWEPSRWSTIARDRRAFAIEIFVSDREKGVAYCIVFTTFSHEVCVFNHALSFFLSLSLSFSRSSGLSSEKILRSAFTIAVCLSRGW